MMGALDTRNMYSNFAINKHLHTVASRCILLIHVACFILSYIVCKIFTDLYQVVDSEMNTRKRIVLIQYALNYLFLILVYAGPSGRAVEGVGLRPRAC